MPNGIDDTGLDDALAESFPASDPLPMNPGTDRAVTRLRIHNSLSDAVAAQVTLLRAGEPLKAFDAFFDEAVLMYSNNTLFASGAAEGRHKQEPFIAAATTIAGRISDVNVLEEKSVCVYRNKTIFTDASGKDHRIDGLSWQRWTGGFIVEERYYDGVQMQQLLDRGILANPAMLLSLSLPFSRHT